MIPKEELARHVVDLHEKGIICGAEVFNVFLSNVSEHTLENYMRALSPQLVARFQSSLQEFVRNPEAYFPLAGSKHLRKWRYRSELMQNWLKQTASEQDATPNGGPATQLDNPGVTDARRRRGKR